MAWEDKLATASCHSITHPFPTICIWGLSNRRVKPWPLSPRDSRTLWCKIHRGTKSQIHLQHFLRSGSPLGVPRGNKAEASPSLSHRSGQPLCKGIVTRMFSRACWIFHNPWMAGRVKNSLLPTGFSALNMVQWPRWTLWKKECVPFFVPWYVCTLHTKAMLPLVKLHYIKRTKFFK